MKFMRNYTNITEVKICPVCGKSFSRRRYGSRLEDYTRFHSRIYCSKSCSAHRRQEDLNRARSSFHRGARKHLKEYCAICGTTQNLQVHHLDRNIKNNTEENLQTLCRSCHMRLHWQQRRLLKNAKKHHLESGKNP